MCVLVRRMWKRSQRSASIVYFCVSLSPCVCFSSYIFAQVALAALRHARSSFGLSVQAHELEEALHFAFAARRVDEEREGGAVGAWGNDEK